ncbi:sugar-binding protein [Schaalia sp. ZJ405]|uniref:sugar-binding transcriptional regulator n=1 Tax=unclassified Schaalia TaxID=2691889 RepID=UPI0013EC3B71|nr:MULTISPECIES: sugar-binding domain-containing protein [unclassified Schaalia]QPK80889.1 sugar-binding protein [Schaalia sp. ZJ405]
MEGDREMLALRAAQLYYYENLTQGAIAERMHCTRWTVGRLLEEAREAGIVRITIAHPQARVRSLEKRFLDAFDITDAIIVREQDSVGATKRLVAQASADFITAIRPRPQSIGVAWGRTITQVSHAMPDDWASGVDIYQTYGGLVRSNDDEVADSIGLMARKARGIGHMLPAPAIVTDAELGRRLRREPSVAKTLTAGPKSDLLLYSPGVLENESVLVRSGFLSPAGMDKLRNMGAATDLFSHFVDREGNPVSQELEARTIGVSLDAVRRAKRKMLVGSGPQKVLPMWIALSIGLASIVVADEVTAEAILSQTP